MSPRHDTGDPMPADDDPTGMRELLSSLPDPGPMPPDLVERITAAIAAERAAASTGLDEVTLRRERRRGPSVPGWRWMTLAAVVLGVVVIGSLPLVDGRATWSAVFAGHDATPAAQAPPTTTPTGAVTPTTPSRASSSRPTRTTSAAGPTADGPGPSEPSSGGAEAPGMGSASAVTVYRSGHAYTAATLGRDVERLGATAGLHPLTSDTPTTGPIGTAKGAWACATALGVPSDARLVVDVATFAGKPAAILRVETSTGSVAYAVKRSCTTGSPGLLAGPAIVG